MPGYWGTRIAAAAYIVFCIYIGALALEFPVGGGTFPLFTVVCAIVICGIMIFGTLRKSARDEKTQMDFRVDFARAKPLLLCALAILYVLVIFELGYFTSTLLFLVAGAWLVGIRNPRTIALTAVVLIPAMYGFFIVFLNAPLPKGILF